MSKCFSFSLAYVPFLILFSKRCVANECSFQRPSHVLVFEVSDVNGVTHIKALLTFSSGLKSRKMSVKVGIGKGEWSEIITLFHYKRVIKVVL